MASVTANKIYYIGPRMTIQFEKYQNLTSGQPSFLQVNVVYIGFLKKWANPGLFSGIFGLFKQTLQIFTTNRCEKMSIQYTVLGFEPMTFGTWISLHNH